jgi:hypothetical protein
MRFITDSDPVPRRRWLRDREALPSLGAPPWTFSSHCMSRTGGQTVAGVASQPLSLLCYLVLAKPLVAQKIVGDDGWAASVGGLCCASRRPGLARNWTTKGEDVLHPRLVRGRSLETDTTCQYCNTAIFGQPSTTLADLFKLHFRADPFSAVRASAR